MDTACGVASMKNKLHVVCSMKTDFPSRASGFFSPNNVVTLWGCYGKRKASGVHR